MKVINKIDGYDKLDNNVKRSIQTGIGRLKERIETYLSYGQKFDDIMMDDKLIHDAYISNGKRFFLYKCRIKAVSLRILYTFEGRNLVVISYVIKKNPRYEYFNHFEDACEKYMNAFHTVSA